MAMNRRDFLKSAALTVAAGMVMGPTALAKEKTESVAEDGKDILNYNPKMKYRPMGQTGVKVSALGFGMLRLPMLADGKTIDMNQTVDMVHRAIDGGVNYIDTGRVYLGGQSELAVGKALASTGIHKPDNEWALDYLWDIPEVSVAVSGMGSMKDVEANLQYAAKAKPNMLTPDEREALGRAIRAYRETPGHIDCTGCYQCIPCPENVAIGYIFAYVYNNYLLHKDLKRAMFDYTTSMSPIQCGDPASSCTNCGQCLAKCPQGLDIPALLKRVEGAFGK